MTFEAPPYHSHVRRDVFDHIPLGGTVLDVGGGDGATAATLKAEGRVARIGVIDMVPPANPQAMDFAYQGNIEEPTLLAKVGAEQGPFDTILCLDILEHFVDPWAVVARLTTMLKPGGVIVASIPNVRHYSVLLPLLLRGRWDYIDAEILDRTHLRFFVRRTAIELMTSSGLTLDRVATIPRLRARDKAARKLTLGLLDGFIALQYVVRVRSEG
jgi:2-polyprenyl-3-methyl-5-hydroxy-6-metoxy-1,4-benzoquinol methylase